MPLETFQHIILETNKKYNQDSCATLAAALAYHSFFSIFPFMLFVIYFGSLTLSTTGVYDLLTSGLIQFLPTGVDTISQVIYATIKLRGSIGLVGAVGLIWSASSVFTVLETALNRIWKAQARGFWRKRLVATVSILALCIGFLGSVTLGQFLPRLLGLIDRPGWQWVGSLGVFFVLVFVISVFYTTFPNRRISRRAAWVGGLVTSAALLLARLIFDVFINSTFVNYGSVYGSLAWFVSLALWAYVVAILFLGGAELGSVLEEEKLLGNG